VLKRGRRLVAGLLQVIDWGWWAGRKSARKERLRGASGARVYTKDGCVSLLEAQRE